MVSRGDFVRLLLTGAVEFPEDKSNISTELQDLVRKFLTVDDTARLGYGLNGLSGIQSHPFFAAVDWMDIVHVRAEPPVIPPAPAPLSSPRPSASEKLPGSSTTAGCRTMNTSACCSVGASRR